MPRLLSDRSGRVALVTYRGLPSLSADDRLLAAEFARAGFEAEGVVWDDPTVGWGRYDAVVIRSTWDYHLRLPEFRAWIELRREGNPAVFNPPGVLQWNAEKSYLRALESAGIPVVPTRWVERHAAVSLSEVIREAGWRDVVVKPIVSASAHRTWRAASPPTAEDEARFRAEHADHPLMVQPLLGEIARDGELSLMFISGEWSHGARKRPRLGDFRVQTEHGGTSEAFVPHETVIEAATRALGCSPEPTLYARVDGCVVDGVFTVMELELLEPSLFFGLAPGSASRFVRALAGRLEELGQGRDRL